MAHDTNGGRPSPYCFAAREEGRVTAVREFIVKATDMPSIINGQVVEFSDTMMGIVMGFTEQAVQILMLGPKARIRAGDRVISTAQSLELPAGEAFVGRIVNALGEPLDDKGPIVDTVLMPVFRDAPGVMERKTVERTLESGTRIIDAIMPLAMGQRQLLLGDRQTGKTTVALDAIINQQNRGVICIYCSIGKTYSSLMKTVELFQARGVFDYGIVVSGIASASVGEQYLAPYTACMLGEYFMQRGRDVLVVFDDLTRHAWVYRQICLLLDRAPGREAYPGDIFYVHSQLMERAGQLSDAHGGGAMTFLPIVETLQGDATGYIPTNLVSMTDGQIYFSTALFNKGLRPAIDIGLSVSRIGNRAQWPAIKESSRTVRIDYVQYLELLQMTQLRTTDLSKEAERKLRHGQAIAELLAQDKNEPLAMEQLVVELYCLNREMLDNLAAADIRTFKQDFYRQICDWFPQFAPNLREKKILIDEMIANLEEAIGQYEQARHA